MLVISVTIKLQCRIIWQLIFNLYMKVSSMLVTSVTIKLQHRVIWKLILRENICNMLIKLQHRVIWQDIFKINMKVWNMNKFNTRENFQRAIFWPQKALSERHSKSMGLCGQVTSTVIHIYHGHGVCSLCQSFNMKIC